MPLPRHWGTQTSARHPSPEGAPGQPSFSWSRVLEAASPCSQPGGDGDSAPQQKKFKNLVLQRFPISPSLKASFIFYKLGEGPHSLKPSSLKFCKVWDFKKCDITMVMLLVSQSNLSFSILIHRFLVNGCMHAKSPPVMFDF